MQNEPSKEIQNWGDAQQYLAEPHSNVDPDKGVQSSVTLITMTERPLDVLAAFVGIYSGKVIRHLDEVTPEMALKALEDVQKTHLQAPLEAIKLHFLEEGVDRSFTQQLERQRTAVYGEQSLRFAVVRNLADASTLPPSLAGTKRTNPFDLRHPRHGEKGFEAWEWSFEDLTSSLWFDMASEPERLRSVWDWTIQQIDRSYNYMAEGHAMPAEEARGILPLATATRVHYVTDMRNLIAHAGNRLCTQAQFHWRQVFSQVVQSIREQGYVKCNGCDGRGWYVEHYGPNDAEQLQCERCDDGYVPGPYAWQYEAIADSNMFRPVCYQLGHCPFDASFDRGCTIRGRVDMNASIGRPSSEWHVVVEHLDAMGDERGMDHPAAKTVVPAINPAEWLLDPGAARL